MSYEEEFDPVRYLQTRLGNLKNVERVLFPLQRFHEEFARLSGSLKILDYGTGPAITTLISASRLASEITLAEYSAQNRDVLRSWLDGTFDSFDWSPLFNHVVRDLEGKSVEEARAREALVRKIVKRVVSCDFTTSPIIEQGSEGPYDVVISSSCLTCCSTLAQYNDNLKNVSALVKRGGTFMLYHSERNMEREVGTYYIGSTPFDIVNVSESHVVEQFLCLGFPDVRSYTCPGDPETMKTQQDKDMLGYMFLVGTRNY